MEILEIEEYNLFLMATLKKFGWQHGMFFHLFTFCSARVRALMIVLSDSLCEIIGK
jgi:hypothetical protein